MSQNLPWCRLKVAVVTHVGTCRAKPHEHAIYNILTSKAAAGGEMIYLMRVLPLTLSFSYAVWFMINRTFSKYYKQQRNCGCRWLWEAYHHRYVPGLNPVDTWRNNTVIITSTHVATSFWRDDNIIIVSHIHWELYIYIYIYIYVCVCVYVYKFITGIDVIGGIFV